MIKIEYIKFQPLDFTTDTTDYLLGVNGERILVEIKFKAEWKINPDADILYTFAGTTIAVTDDDGDPIVDIWKSNEFKIGDIITITGSVSNNLTTGVITGFSTDGSIATFASPTFTGEVDTPSVTIEGATALTGVSYLFNFIENNAAETFISLIDGYENKYTRSGISSTSYVNLEHQGTWKSNEIGGVQIKSTGVLNEFIIQHTTHVMPFVLPGQLLNLEGFVAPEYYFDLACLRYIYNIKLHKALLNPNHIQETDSSGFLLGNTGWLNVNFNGGVPKYVVDAMIFYDEDNEYIEFPDYSKVNKFEIHIRSVDGKFSNNNTKFSVQHFFVPETPADLLDQPDVNLTTNYMFDYAVNTTGSAAVNGVNNATTSQVLKDVRATFTNSGNIKIFGEVDYSNGYKARFDTNTKNIALTVVTQDHLLQTEASDKVAMLAWVGKVIKDTSNSDIGYSDTSFTSHPYDEVTSGNEDAGLFVEDWQLGVTNFAVDTSVGGVIKNVGVRIYATHNTHGEFTLEEKTFNTENAPVVEGVQILSENFSRGYKMGEGNIFNQYSLSRFAASDDGDFKAYRLLYPFKIRWENFVSLPGVSQQFYDPSLPQKGFNNNWNRYFAATGWTLKYKFFFTAAAAGTDNVIESVKDVEAYNYGDATDWTYSIETYDFATNTEITGNVLTDKKTLVKCIATKTTGVELGVDDVSGIIGVNAFEAGTDKSIRELSSVHDFEADTPWISIDENNKLKIVKVASNTFELTGVLDNSKLIGLFPTAIKFDISARIEENPEWLGNAKLFQDGEGFMFQDGEQYLFQ